MPFPTAVRQLPTGHAANKLPPYGEAIRPYKSSNHFVAPTFRQEGDLIAPTVCVRQTERSISQLRTFSPSVRPIAISVSGSNSEAQDGNRGVPPVCLAGRSTTRSACRSGQGHERRRTAKYDECGWVVDWLTAACSQWVPRQTDVDTPVIIGFPCLIPPNSAYFSY